MAECRQIIHVDMDAFYASVEQLQHEIAKRERAEERLVSVQSKLDNINLIVHKHL